MNTTNNDTEAMLLRLNNIRDLTVRISNVKKQLLQLEEEQSHLISSMQISHSHTKIKRQNITNYITRVMAPGAHMTIKTIVEKIQELGYVTRGKSSSNYIFWTVNNKFTCIVSAFCYRSFTAFIEEYRATM